MMMIFLLAGDCFTGIRHAVVKKEIQWLKILQKPIKTGKDLSVSKDVTQWECSDIAGRVQDSGKQFGITEYSWRYTDTMIQH